MAPNGKKITAVRADSAAYQAEIFNWCEATGKVFAIGADQDAVVKVASGRWVPPSSKDESFSSRDFPHRGFGLHKTQLYLEMIALESFARFSLYGCVLARTHMLGIQGE
ncbi:MAG: hypothetical protein ACRECV_17310 [Xanthobacteraceae bacterium]